MTAAPQQPADEAEGDEGQDDDHRGHGHVHALGAGAGGGRRVRREEGGAVVAPGRRGGVRRGRHDGRDGAG